MCNIESAILLNVNAVVWRTKQVFQIFMKKMLEKREVQQLIFFEAM